MTIRRPRIALLAVLVFLVAGLGLGAWQPDPGLRPGDIAAAAAKVASWPPDMVAAMERDLNRDRQQIIEHEAFVAVALPLADRLKARLGKQFGGAWMDDSGTELLVAVTRASLAATVRAAGARPVVVARSEADLAAIRDRLTATPRASDSVSIWYADPESNQVVVRAPDQAAARRWVRASGVDASAVRIVHGDRMRVEADGGVGYDTNTTQCAVGFGARMGPELGFVTAGHCGRTNTETRNGPAGTFRASVFPGSDSAFVRLRDVREATPFILGPGGGRIGINFVGSEWAIRVGQQNVCHYGPSFAWQCGEVKAVDAVQEVFDPVQGFSLGVVDRVTATDACSGPRDSGGPWVLGTSAIGVHSSATSLTCGPGRMSTFVPIEQVMTDLPGLQILTVQPQMPDDLRVIRLACGNSPPQTPTIRCLANWEGSVNPATAHWSVSPDTPVGVNTDPVIKRSLMQFTCDTESHDFEFEYEVTIVVVDKLGRMASKTGTVPCISIW